MLSNSKGGVFTARALRDSQSGMWVIGRDLLDRILPGSDGMAFSEEIKIRAFKCCKCAEVPVKYRKRVGKSKISTALDGIGNLLHLLQLRFINFRGHWRDEGGGNMSKVLARARNEVQRG